MSIPQSPNTRNIGSLGSPRNLGSPSLTLRKTSFDAASRSPVVSPLNIPSPPIQDVNLSDLENNSPRRPIGSPKPSSKGSLAYQMALERSRSSSSYEEPKSRNITEKLSFKVVMAAVCLFFCGLVIFTTGAVIYWSSTPTSKNTGLDLIIFGTILLIPGSWATCIVINFWRGKKDYQYGRLSDLNDVLNENFDD